MDLSDKGWSHDKTMSALPPKADMCSALDHVCFGPKADMSYSTPSPANQPFAVLLAIG
jgi:hypothetical protein